MLTAQLKKPQNTVTYENVDILLFISVTLKHRFTVYIINDSTLVMMCHVLAIKKRKELVYATYHVRRPSLTYS